MRTMTTYPSLLILSLTSLLFVGTALGQPFIYPSQGQSPEQQQRDRYECHTWAVQQTGFDPSMSQGAMAPAPAPQGGVLRGGARGAALGAVGGAIAGDAGKGAAIGAATGGLFGGMRQADQRRQQEAVQAQYQAAASQQQAAYTRALGACLTGRGYTVQ
jgi:YMGG-like Gly-zipper